ncbi:MAG: hypothetical protein OEL83_20660 [Desulforhopalus sp.]|nr:hypothetical protein [Desulforhopalus sp.]
MADTEKVEGWVYVFVCDPGESESFLGLHNAEKDVHFIPAFRTKEEANDCFLNLPREKGRKYELQAVHVEELQSDANKNNFVVVFVDRDGKVVSE